MHFPHNEIGATLHATSLAKVMALLSLLAPSIARSDAPQSYTADSHTVAELATLVRDLIEGNYANIETLSLTLRVTKQQPTVKEPHVVELKRDDGYVVKTYLSPTVVTNVALDIDERGIRRDETDASPFGVMLPATERSFLLMNGEMTELAKGKSNLAWIRSPEAIGPTLAIDPRSIAPTLAGSSPGSVLSPEFVLDAAYVEADAEDGDNSIRIHLDLPTRPPAWFTFSESVGYLPVEMIARYDDNSLCGVMSFEYQHVPEHNMWLPKRLVSRAFVRGKVHDVASSSYEQLVEQVVTSYHINSPIPSDRFVLDLPDGTVVRDTIRDTISVVGRIRSTVSTQDLRPAEKEGHTRWLIIGNLVVLAIVAVSWIARRSFARHGPPSGDR